MGYRSYHNVTVEAFNGYEPSREEFFKIIDDFRTECAEAEYSLNPDGSTADETKWYDSNDDLKKFSKKYPKVLFVLDREGEESIDIERTWFLNGKMQQTFAKIVFDDFNPEALR